MIDANLKVACVQMTSGSDIEKNLRHADKLIRRAASGGASFIITPENTCHIRVPTAKKLEYVKSQEDHVAVLFFSNLAAELEITLLIGSISVKNNDGKLSNRSLLFSPDGMLSTTYDKIHLFDVQLPSGETHQESSVFAAGNSAETYQINSEFCAGLSICYDLRFAHLYRELAQSGANILCVPAAFTVSTGYAHWEVLLRARAIETGCYVMAAAQVGEHEGGRMTYGHSMIIDPWGVVIAKIENEEGVITADLDISKVNQARHAIPALKHDREYTLKGEI